MVNIPKRSISPFETSPSSQRTAIERGIQGFYGNWGHRKKHFCVSITAKIWPAELNMALNITFSFIYLPDGWWTTLQYVWKGLPPLSVACTQVALRPVLMSTTGRDSSRINVKSVWQTMAWAETSRAGCVGKCYSEHVTRTENETNSCTNVK